MPADDEVRKDLSGVSVRVSHGIFWGNFASREEQQEGAERGMHSLVLGTATSQSGWSHSLFA